MNDDVQYSMQSFITSIHHLLLSQIPNKENWTIYPIINATIAVDTFFTMSAILMAYLLLKTLDKSNGRLNILKLYIHRYLRLTPTYALLIGIMATWYQYLRPGPLTYQLEYASESCQKNWWHNLLYINNFIKYPPDWSNQRVSLFTLVLIKIFLFQCTVQVKI